MSEKRKPRLDYKVLAIEALTEQVEQLARATRETDLALLQALKDFSERLTQFGEMLISLAVTVEENRFDTVQLVEAFRRQHEESQRQADEIADLRRMLGATGPAPRRSSEPPEEDRAA